MQFWKILIFSYMIRTYKFKAIGDYSQKTSHSLGGQNYLFVRNYFAKSVILGERSWSKGQEKCDVFQNDPLATSLQF